LEWGRTWEPWGKGRGLNEGSEKTGRQSGGRKDVVAIEKRLMERGGGNLGIESVRAKEY